MVQCLHFRILEFPLKRCLLSSVYRPFNHRFQVLACVIHSQSALFGWSGHCAGDFINYGVQGGCECANDNCLGRTADLQFSVYFVSQMQAPLAYSLVQDGQICTNRDSLTGLWARGSKQACTLLVAGKGKDQGLWWESLLLSQRWGRMRLCYWSLCRPKPKWWLVNLWNWCSIAAHTKSNLRLLTGQGWRALLRLQQPQGSWAVDNGRLFGVLRTACHRTSTFARLVQRWFFPICSRKWRLRLCHGYELQWQDGSFKLGHLLSTSTCRLSSYRFKRFGVWTWVI